MKQHKTIPKSKQEAAKKAVNQKDIDTKVVQDACDHKDWNFDIGEHSSCPTCGMTMAEAILGERYRK